MPIIYCHGSQTAFPRFVLGDSELGLAEAAGGRCVAGAAQAGGRFGALVLAQVFGNFALRVRLRM